MVGVIMVQLTFNCFGVSSGGQMRSINSLGEQTEMKSSIDLDG